MKTLNYLVAGMIGAGSLALSLKSSAQPIFLPKTFPAISIDSAEYTLDNSKKKPNFFQIIVYFSDSSKTCYDYDKSSKHMEITFFDEKATKITNNQFNKKELKETFKVLCNYMKFCYKNHSHPKRFTLKNTQEGIFYPLTYQQPEIRIPWF